MADAKRIRASELLKEPGTTLVMKGSDFYLIKLPYFDSIIDAESQDLRLLEARQILSALEESDQFNDSGLQTDEAKLGYRCITHHTKNLIGAEIIKLDQESLAFD